jgi:F-type H+-transporting ATPase subunit b
MAAMPRSAPAPTPVTHASTVPAEQSSSGLPQFDIAQWPGQVVWILIVFVVMFLLFSRVFVPRVGGTISAREDRIAGDIGDARRMKAEADAEAAASAAETAQAHARAQRLALEARTRVQDEAAAEGALEQAKLAEQMARAETQITMARNEALKHVRQIAADAATAIVEKLTGHAPTAAQLSAARGRGGAR